MENIEAGRALSLDEAVALALAEEAVLPYLASTPTGAIRSKR